MTYDAIESLEPRIAPAAVFSYRDADGDLVKLISSKGTDSQLSAIISFSLLDLTHIEVKKINFAADAATFGGTSLTMKVTPNPLGGDGRANIGAIIATGMDLGDINITGDLGQIEVGNPSLATPALKSLTVGSLGREGLTTQGGTGDLTSAFTGYVPRITIRGDMVNSGIVSSGFGAGFGSISIGGSIRDGGIGTTGTLGKLTVGGDVIGLSIPSSGAVSAGSIGSIAIKGSLIGGKAQSTGNIFSSGNISSIVIGGSLVGGDAVNSGVVSATGKIGNVSIGRDLIGGAPPNSGQVSGLVSAGGDIVKARVGGSIFAAKTQGEFHNTGIRSGGQLGSVIVAGSLIGQVQSNPVCITGSGDSTPGPTSNIAIGSVKIGGSAINARIAGGIGQAEYPIFVTGTNGDAQIGSILIKGDLIGSSIQSGVKSPDFFIGNGDDVVINTGNNPNIIASIAKIVIGGEVRNTDESNVFGSGIAAEHFGSVKIGLANLKLNAFGQTKDRIALGSLGRTVSLWEV